MSADRFDLDLTRPAQSGVYFVGIDDLDRLSRAAAKAAYLAWRKSRKK